MVNSSMSFTPPEDTCALDNLPREFSDMPESHPKNKSLPSKHKSRKFKASSLIASAFPTLDLASISNDVALKPYWNDACAEINLKLWCPTKTDLQELASSSSASSSSPEVVRSSHLINETRNQDSTQSLLLDLSRVSAIPTTASEVAVARKIRLYPKVTDQWFKVIHAARRAYNMTIAIFREQDRLPVRDKLSQVDVRRTIREAVLVEYENAVPSVSLDEAVNRAFETRASVIKRRSRGEKCDYSFKSRKDATQSFVVQRLGKTPYPTFLGEVHITEAIPTEAFGKMARVVYEYGRWFLCAKKLTRVATSESQGLRVVAVDPGVRTFAAAYSSDVFSKIGEGFNTRIFDLAIRLDRLIGERQNLANVIPSQWSERTQWMRDEWRCVTKKIDRLRCKIKDLVNDLHKRTAHYLTENFDVILLPTFEVKGMTERQGRKIRSKTVRQMLGLAHFKFKTFVKWIAQKKGKHVIDVNEAYTSKTDSRTGIITLNLGGARTINGLERDFNGARGILLRSLTRQLEPEIGTTVATSVANVAV